MARISAFIQTNSRTVLGTILLLLIAASRFLLLPNLTFDQDEVWSIWVSFGTPQEIIARTPFNLPSGFYLVREFAGYTPFAMRIFLILIFMVNCAAMFAAASKLLKSESAGWVAMLAYAAIGFIIYLSVLLRSYALFMVLFPLAFLLTMRYFERPSWRRAIACGLAVAAMYYISLMAVFGYLVFIGYTLFMHPRTLWRGILPGSIAFVLALPEILSKLSVVLARGSVSFETNLPPLHIAFFDMYTRYLGTATPIWVGLMAVALVLIIISRNTFNKTHIFLLLWMLGGPILLYMLHPRTNFFSIPRYSVWVAPGIAMWLAYGLTHIPRIGQIFLTVSLIILLYVPQPISEYKEPVPAFEPTFRWLAEYYEPRDVVVIYPNIAQEYGPFRPEMWDYYQLVFFQNDLAIVEQPETHHRRVWYFRTISQEDPATSQSVIEGRIGSIFNGSPGFFVQLHQAAPDPSGVLFENGLRFHGYEVLDGEGIETGTIVRREGSSLRLRLWWSVDRPLDAEVSVSVQIFRESTGTLFVQNDTAPQAIQLQPNIFEVPTTMRDWLPGEYYIEERILELPLTPRLHRDTLQVFLTPYQWWDGTRLNAPGINEDMLLPIFHFHIMAW